MSSYISRNSLLSLVFTLLLPCSLISAEPGRTVMELSGADWTLRLDPGAEWLDDDIHLPPVEVSRLPANPPSMGWERFDFTAGKRVRVPGTVEEHYWGANGNPNGTAGDYRGVSWWSARFRLDPALRGKRIVISFESVNLRAEVFVNRKLVGYDVIGNTPFEVDAGDALNFDGEDRLDIRITDPVGNFDWNDNELFPWGKNLVPGVHGFGGITGRIFLSATDAVHIDDIYIRNSPKITEAEVFATLGNSLGRDQKGKLSLTVRERGNGAVLWKGETPATVPPDGRTFSFTVNAPKAKPWSLSDPRLYVATASFMSADGTIADES
ncbi:MAG: sugar-binding domain-containing protein, partial [Candidatus Latescibacterota bacterium]